MQTKYRQLAGILVLAIGGLTTGSASSATSQVLYDNTGNGTTDPLSSFFNNNNWGASLFTVAPSSCGSLGCLLDKITLRLGVNPVGGPNISTGLTNFSNFDLTIWNDNGTQTGTGTTAIAASMSIYNPTGATDNPSSGLIELGAASKYYEFTPATSVTLNDGFSYWVRLTGKSPSDPSIRWDVVSGDTREQAFAGGTFLTGAITGSSYVMKIEATPNVSAVPIPGAVWLMGSALVGFVGWGRRHQV